MQIKWTKWSKEMHAKQATVRDGGAGARESLGAKSWADSDDFNCQERRMEADDVSGDWDASCPK